MKGRKPNPNREWKPGESVFQFTPDDGIIVANLIPPEVAAERQRAKEVNDDGELIPHYDQLSIALINCPMIANDIISDMFLLARHAEAMEASKAAAEKAAKLKLPGYRASLRRHVQGAEKQKAR